uniref:Mitochondrial fission factor n=1 Tax=Panagrolaimus sp. ES5 TaxID=591445 RepID=A0AC34FZZ9_9BILA
MHQNSFADNAAAMVNGYQPMTMFVPEHIYVNGTGNKRSKHQSLNQYEASTVLEEMRVPDRIVLGGGDTHIGNKADPTEVMADRLRTIPILTPGHEVPTHLTAEDLHQPEELADNQYNNSSEASIAIEDDPLRELKMMRKQLGRLSTRVMQLEDDRTSRNTRETALWITLLATITTIAFGMFRRKGALY